nr:MAG TPA: hypothetical protein [Caudoviricetes sp.]
MGTIIIQTPTESLKGVSIRCPFFVDNQRVTSIINSI